MYCEKWRPVAEMCLFLEDLREGSRILCLCSRAFVEDRKLYNLGLKGYYVKDDDSSAGNTENKPRKRRKEATPRALQSPMTTDA